MIKNMKSRLGVVFKNFMRLSFSSEKKTSTSGTPKYLTSRKTVILPRVDAAMHRREPSTAPKA